MSNRNLFAELSTALVEAKEHAEGKLTLKTHRVNDARSLSRIVSQALSRNPQFNMLPSRLQHIHQTINSKQMNLPIEQATKI